MTDNHEGDAIQTSRTSQLKQKYGITQNDVATVTIQDDAPNEGIRQQEVAGNPQEAEDLEVQEESVKEPIILPSGLQRRVTQQLMMAGAVAILTIVLVVLYKTPQCLFGFAASGALVHMAVSIKYDYRDGKVMELCLMCVSITEMHMRKSARVIFRTQDEVPLYYEFILPGKKHSEFIANHVYLVYFREDEPKNLLGHTAL